MDYKISLIIPIYNGEQYLRDTFKELAAFLSTRKGQWEIICVDDGSTDRTLALLEELKMTALFPVTILWHEKNKGKGEAVRYGLSHVGAESAYVAYTDVELPYGLAVLEEGVRRLEQTGADVCLGRREQSGTRQYSLYRKIGTTIFHFFLPRCVKNIQDTQSGCKIFCLAVAEQIFSRVKTKRWVFDVEVLLAAVHSGFVVEEIPVVIKPSCITPKGGVSLLKHGIFILLDILRIHWYEISGKYKK